MRRLEDVLASSSSPTDSSIQNLINEFPPLYKDLADQDYNWNNLQGAAKAKESR